MAAAAAAASAGPVAAPASPERPAELRSSLKTELMALIDKRARMEEEMDVLLAALGSDGLTSSLVDGEPDGVEARRRRRLCALHNQSRSLIPTSLRRARRRRGISPL